MLVRLIQASPFLGIVPFGAILRPFGVEAQTVGLAVQIVGFSMMVVFRKRLFI